jgi:hypothetical protein
LTIDSNWRGENCRDKTAVATESFGRPTQIHSYDRSLV